MSLKIAYRIGLGFFLILAAVVYNSVQTAMSLSHSRELNSQITTMYGPSLELTNKLYTQISDSRMLIKSWVHIDKKSNTPDKIRLRQLHTTEYPELMDSIVNILKTCKDEKNEKLVNRIKVTIEDTLIQKHVYVMNQLNTFENYDDFSIIAMTTLMVDEDGDIMKYTRDVLHMIDELRINLDTLVTANQKDMIDAFDRFRREIIVMLIVLILFSFIIAIITIRSLVLPINKTKNILLTMSKGVMPDISLREGKDEIGQMGIALNRLVSALKAIVSFTIEIGKGNFSTDYKALSDEDQLGQSLLQMRLELIKAKEDEGKRQEENKQRTWTSQGVAMFSDILRGNNDDLEKLSYEIISNMVQYTESNQGGIFIVNETDPKNKYLEMVSCYAYDRQKFLKRKIEEGEGLVGRCYQEQEKIFLTDIPSDYIKITSGLGEENPKCLLLIPLAYNDNIFGIMEIASFSVYQSYQVDFMERIGESIAATISSVKANIQTTELLEKTQQQAEEMYSQEEEMRQNMEELRATQEQSLRREEDLQREVDSLKRKIREIQGSDK
ncbi:MAG: GAF domain-containing protein [Bacteroidales bacterium]|nr:GAF domain-containing protein [Bacteroidales bacterium]